MNRQGLPVFSPDQDLASLFGADDPSDRDAFEKKDADRSEAPSPRQTRTPPKPMRMTRQGFPVLDDADVEALLMQRADSHDGEEGSRRSSAEPPPTPSSLRRDRHGIPVLKPGDRLFRDDARPEESFEELLNESLGNKSVEVLLREKKDDVRPPRPVSLKKKLKAYPLPQSQLDLHGYTALKAGLRTESYLKSAYHGNTHTVIIIVGKGLHSEEGAVLPDVVEQKLFDLKKEKLILAYEWDNKKKSKSGAVTVYLDNLRFD
ncbi:hypothetical protein JCM14469_13020 [Desulfatiferula olefinivorans]